jgi:hypothetical protein
MAMLVLLYSVQQALQIDVVPQQGFLFLPHVRVRHVPLFAVNTRQNALPPSGYMELDSA